MVVIKSTDNKYVGKKLIGPFKLGAIINLDGFILEIGYIFERNGNLVIGFPNYQLELKE